jgi:hypothetical protein
MPGNGKHESVSLKQKHRGCKDGGVAVLGDNCRLGNVEAPDNFIA